MYLKGNGLERLEGKIQYRFKNAALLSEAMSHASYVYEKRGKGLNSNERLEYLGDAVVEMVVSEHLFLSNPGATEGDLTKKRASLVREETLAEIARRINLGEHLLLGRGEENAGGRGRASILASAFEALAAAVYLDGGLADVRRMLLALMEDFICKDELLPVDYKTILQEEVQKRGKVVSYSLMREQGPDHNRLFVVGACVDSRIIGEGCGVSLKAAEQEAAKQALEAMGVRAT